LLAPSGNRAILLIEHLRQSSTAAPDHCGQGPPTTVFGRMVPLPLQPEQVEAV